MARFGNHATHNKVVDQRNSCGGKVFRHRSPGELVIVFLERRQDPPMIPYRLVVPAPDGGEHRFRCVAGNL